MNTYGMHTIHGRAPAIATGLAMARPDLDIWVVAGDGDALSIGGNHLIHALRRNVNLTILRVQQPDLRPDQGPVLADLARSGRSRSRRRSGASTTRSTRCRSPSAPRPASWPAPTTWTAATCSRRSGGPTTTGARPIVEIYQNCNVFNDGAFEKVTGKEVRSDMLIPLRHGEPIRFGAEGDKGVVADADGRAAGRRRGRGRRGPPARARRGPGRPRARLRPVPPVPWARTSRRRSACSGPSSGPSTSPRATASSPPPSPSGARAISPPCCAAGSTWQVTA